MFLIKILLFTAFCVVNTNALLDKGFNNTCFEIVEDPTYAFYDLDVIECNLVTISQIKLTNNGLSFRLNNPNTRTPDYINLHKTEQKLFNGNTIVHFAKRVNYRWKIGHTKTLGQYLPGFDGVTLYHNYFRRSAIMLYRKGSSYIVEGNIGGRILRYINGNDLDGDNSTYVLALLALAKEKELEREFDYDTYKQEYYNLGAENLERVHVKLLPIIDGRILNYGIIDARTLLRPILSYYNYIDMLFGVFTSPIISFNISGIVIPETEALMPFVDRKNAVPSTIYLIDILNGLTQFMNSKKTYFGLSSYDIVVLMAGRRLFKDISESHGSVSSKNFYKRAICDATENPSVIYSVYSDYLHDYLIWFFISKFATSARIKHELKHCEGFGETYIRMNSRRRTFLPWIDQCVANMMSHYFKNHDCSYFSTNEF
ncbi:uncharacterized protein LOC141533667 [Cotesia typhae]|uniref:uncharacterized protein LOC141533667 n=1 Tax=Cotesia typhae TaxID=2053667 RepID=UPI003D682E83